MIKRNFRFKETVAKQRRIKETIVCLYLISALEN